MKKRIIIILSIIIAVFIITKLYQTFAISSLISGNTDTVYDVTLSGTTTVSVPANSNKTVIYQVCNTNKGTVKYGIGYQSSNIIVKEDITGIDPYTGFIDYGENKFVKLKLINNSSQDDTVILSSVLGYENGGELIPLEGVILVTDIVSVSNTLKNASVDNIAGKPENEQVIACDPLETDCNVSFLGSSVVTRDEISSVTFVDHNVVPFNIEGSEDVSFDNDGSVMMWYTKNANDLYDVTIGGSNGKVYLSSGSCLFRGLINATSITFNDVVETSAVKNFSQMFYACQKLTTLDLSSFNTSNAIYLEGMFSQCANLTSLDLNHFNTEKVTTMSDMFRYCSSLTNLNISNWNTANVTTMRCMFYHCASLTSLDLNHFNTEKVTTMSEMFRYCSSLTNLNVSNWNTEKVTTMGGMFNECVSLATLNVSNWSTSKVTNMAHMFRLCQKLTSLDVSDWNTSNVTDMNYMFSSCASLTALDVSNWNTSKVTNMAGLFNDCQKLESIDVSGWQTQEVTNMAKVFRNCVLLTNIDVSGWNTGNVQYMNEMFHCCYKLTTLDLSSFNTAQVTNMSGMFTWNNKLQTIYVSTLWTTSAVTESTDMFKGCTSLVGGSNTAYNASFIDKTYAIIDGGTSNPGYLTAKTTA